MTFGEFLLTLALWVLRAVFVAVIPFALITALAVISGLVRTAAFPLLVLAFAATRASESAGHAVPLPRFPRFAEVTR